jgi:hypothetical protein
LKIIIPTAQKINVKLKWGRKNMAKIKAEEAVTSKK